MVMAKVTAKKKKKVDVVQFLANSIDMVELSKINCHPNNPRRGDVGFLADLIKRVGFTTPILVQRSTGYILAGNHRFMALESLVEAGHKSIKKVPVVYLDVDDARAKEILLSDNRSSDVAGYDSEALTTLLQELLDSGSNLSDVGYSKEYLDSMLESGEKLSDDIDDSLPAPETVPFDEAEPTDSPNEMLAPKQRAPIELPKLDGMSNFEPSKVNSTPVREKVVRGDAVRELKLYYKVDDYDVLLNQLEMVRSENNLETPSQAVAFLASNYKAGKKGKK